MGFWEHGNGRLGSMNSPPTEWNNASKTIKKTQVKDTDLKVCKKMTYT